MRVFKCLNCHTSVVAYCKPDRCRACLAGAAWMKDEAEVSLPGFDLEYERVAALAQSQGEELTERLRSPKADVSAKAGEMERNAPLFYGTGDNPTLF